MYQNQSHTPSPSSFPLSTQCLTLSLQSICSALPHRQKKQQAIIIHLLIQLSYIFLLRTIFFWHDIYLIVRLFYTNPTPNSNSPHLLPLIIGGNHCPHHHTCLLALTCFCITYIAQTKRKFKYCGKRKSKFWHDFCLNYTLFYTNPTLIKATNRSPKGTVSYSWGRVKHV